MAVSLTKGQRVSLEKVAPGLSEVFVGLGWDVKATDTGSDFDLDSSVFLLGANEKLISDKHFIFYNNLVSPDPNKSVQHIGDNLTGLGEGDDEVIKIDLKKVPEEVKKIVITVCTLLKSLPACPGMSRNRLFQVVDPASTPDHVIVRFGK